MLWRAGLAHRRRRATSAPSSITLEHICEGGIYDHLGGGFSRYSVDERWLVPHFEKMLYDNAQLLELLALALRSATGNAALSRSARSETVGWLAREMTTGEGAFSASLDADSEGEEGKFYVWSLPRSIKRARRRGRRLLCAPLRRDAGGNFEGHNILNRLTRMPRSDDDEARLARAARKTARRARARACGPASTTRCWPTGTA